jgi:hypothetical protein
MRGQSFSIKASFFARDQPLSCFSQEIASSMWWKSEE